MVIADGPLWKQDHKPVWEHQPTSIGWHRSAGYSMAQSLLRRRGVSTTIIAWVGLNVTSWQAQRLKMQSVDPRFQDIQDIVVARSQCSPLRAHGAMESVPLTLAVSLPCLSW